MTGRPAPYAALVAAHGLSPAHRLLLDAVPGGARRVMFTAFGE